MTVKKKFLIIMAALCLGLNSTIVMGYTIINAFFSPNYERTISLVSVFGMTEAYLDLGVFIISLIIILFAMCILFKKRNYSTNP